MVAVRLLLLEAPEEKSNVALPVASVVTVAAPKTPVLVPILTTTLGTAAFTLFRATTVIVVVVELSDLTVVGDIDNWRLATDDDAPGAAGSGARNTSLPPPHPTNSVIIKKVINFAIISFISIVSGTL